MKTNIRFLMLGLSILLVVSVGVQPIFAEKIVTVQRTVDVDKESIINSLSNLEKYPYILPDHIQSSRVIGENTANMKIGLDWITVNVDVKIVKSNDKITLEVISGDFKGTKLYVETSEVKNIKNSLNEKTNVSVKINLQRNWHMEILTSFVSDDNIKSMLNTSLNELVHYIKNPQTFEDKIEKEKFCIFGLCF